MATAQNWGPMAAENARVTVTRPYTEAASQTFVAGDLVTLSSGKVAIAKAAGNTMVAADKILGRAASDASGTTDAAIDVHVFLPGHTERLPVYHGTAASAVTAITDVGTAYGLRNDATQGWCIALDETGATTTKVRIVGIAPDFPVGEQYGLEDAVYLTASLLAAGA